MCELNAFGLNMVEVSLIVFGISAIFALLIFLLYLGVKHQGGSNSNYGYTQDGGYQPMWSSTPSKPNPPPKKP